MAFTDCINCWQTPCVCGHDYKRLSIEHRESIASAAGGSAAELKSLADTIQKLQADNLQQAEQLAEVVEYATTQSAALHFCSKYGLKVTESELAAIALALPLPKAMQEKA